MLFQLATRLRCTLVFTAWLTLGLTQTAMAGLVGEDSWREVSQDERYVLVMVSSYSADEEIGCLARWPKYQAEVREIRAKYKTSGLYRNDGSTEPLWTIPYHLPVYEIYVSPNGQQVLIVIEDWEHTISNIPGGGSLFFYDKDGKIASYQDYELTWCWVLKGLANALMGRSFAQCEKASFDPEALTYTVKTSQSEEMVFDITTGKIVRRWSLWPFYLGVPFFGVPAALFGYYRIRPQQTKAERTKRPKWAQFSLRGMLLFVTAVCIFLWGTSFNFLWDMSFTSVFVIACMVIVFLGGGIAWICSKTRQAWMIGAILALYGSFFGLVAWARIGDFFDWWRYMPAATIWTIVALELVGVLAGGLVAGWTERTQTVTRNRQANATAVSAARHL